MLCCMTHRYGLCSTAVCARSWELACARLLAPPMECSKRPRVAALEMLALEEQQREGRSSSPHASPAEWYLRSHT